MNTSETVSPTEINSPPTKNGPQVQADFKYDSLQDLSQRLARIEKMLNDVSSTLTQMPGMLAIMADTADEVYQETAQNGVNIDERLKVTLQLVERITQPETLEKIDAVLAFSQQLPSLMAMGVDVLDEQVKGMEKSGTNLTALLELASIASDSLSKAKTETPAKIGGPFGLLKVLKDTDRQRGLGFFMNFIKHFGKNLKA